jgi:hypothetical protein
MKTLFLIAMLLMNGAALMADATPSPAGYQTRQVAGRTMQLKDELLAQQKPQVDAAVYIPYAEVNIGRFVTAVAS